MVSHVAAADARRARFEALAGRVWEPLQRYARRRADPEAAADVVADALLVIWRRLDDVPADAELPWCYAVTRNCLANARRSSVRAGRLVDRIAAEPAPGELRGTSVDAELEEALDALDADDRELLRLWAWEQLEPREIAMVLDVTPNAVSIRLHRARARLAELLTATGKTTALPGHRRAVHREDPT